MSKIVSKIAVFLIKVYQVVFSPDHGFLKVFFRNPVCKYYPTCSEYAELAIKKYGPIKGIFRAGKRLSRCNPWSKGGVDMP